MDRRRLPGNPCRDADVRAGVGRKRKREEREWREERESVGAAGSVEATRDTALTGPP
jgi:hypothetical protein